MNERDHISSLIHLIGMFLSIAGLVLLIVYASISRTVWHVVSFAIFGASLILLYSTSTIYHISKKETKRRNIFRRIDHSMIYVLIAGTYTPVCLTSLRGGWGWSLFGIIWFLAITGVIVKSIGIKIPGRLSSILYIMMGWLGVIAIIPLIQNLGKISFFWLFLGGVFYTVGVIFFTLDYLYPRKKLTGFHDIFHIFVILGSFSHFWFMFRYLI